MCSYFRSLGLRKILYSPMQLRKMYTQWTGNNDIMHTDQIKVAIHRKQQVNNKIHGLFIDIDRQPAMPNSRNTNFTARAHHHGG